MRFLRVFYCCYALLLFFLCMLLVIPPVVVASFFGKVRGGNFIYRLCGYWASVWFFLIGIRHRNLYEQPHDKNKQYIFVANHISYLDAPVIVKALHQKVRALGKVEVSKVPLFGFIYRNAVVTVDRSSAAARANSVRILKSVIRKGISIFIFPEGTFNETGKPLKELYDGAFRIAIETQTPIKPILFLDTWHRMHYSTVWSLNPGRSRTVFLPEIPVNALTGKDVGALKEQVRRVMEEKLKEYNAGWLE
ncbi:acyl-phosphate glycerol 3-phosphate acyltransferase [Niastella vici]|uniref:Acyl-phosphate glycerol 3-phosphate acyltransferase n=1 Tax=Niastella vici TaxID=1703345 RepID=A0A1V9FHH2_9BACT|nr:lysophospholipid acyltransferase family protein [Niastella vici]OQP57815.1 acyl-phosphate glycerol 3-phosphate acyltransferase [Niastella vici]